MIVYNNFDISKKFKNSIIAIGNFDGLHLGHRKVLKNALEMAKKYKLKLGVITFEPVPVMFFNKNIINHRINSLLQKIENLKKIKIDFLNIIRFNKKFSNLTPDQFIKKILYKHLSCKFVFVSKNFRFGKNREGDIYKLKKEEDTFLYKTIVASPLKKNRSVLSSSIIRDLISKGKVDIVNKFLGKPWSIRGKVIKGDQRGRKIGFPTCNIKLAEYVIPKLGVYSVQVCIGKINKKGIANIGYRPTFKGKSLLLEVNIFGLKKNLYKKTINVDFIKFIRPEKRFKNMKELKIQIKKDIIKAKK